MAKNGLPTSKIYDLIDKLRQEFTDAILRVEGKVDLIESNHLMGIKADLEKIKADFSPVKNLVYGLVGLVMSAVIGALLFLVLKR